MIIPGGGIEMAQVKAGQVVNKQVLKTLQLREEELARELHRLQSEISYFKMITRGNGTRGKS